jgi:hypothetical protein
MDATSNERNALGGLARSIGLEEDSIGRFIDAVREFDLDARRFAARIRAAGLGELDFFGISRLEQRPRPRLDDGTKPDVPLEEQWHGWTRTWRVRLYVLDPDLRTEESFSYSPDTAEEALVDAMVFRNRNLRKPHQPRGPYNQRRKRPSKLAS